MDLLGEESSVAWLLERYHPEGLRCPRCGANSDRARLFRRTKRSQLDVYRCMACGRTYNLYTGTPFEGKHLRPEQVTALLDGLAEGKSNPKLAGELGLNRTTVYYLRRELEESGVVWSDGGSRGQIRPGARKEPAVRPNNGGHGQEGGR